MDRVTVNDLSAQPLNSTQVKNYMSAAQAKIPAPRAKAQCTSLHLDTSKLVYTGMVNLQNLDFAAIADSSVGGAGLPRPYGRFNAGRMGDGTAMWERAPPSRLAQPRNISGSPGGPSLVVSGAMPQEASHSMERGASPSREQVGVSHAMHPCSMHLSHACS